MTRIRSALPVLMLMLAAVPARATSWGDGGMYFTAAVPAGRVEISMTCAVPAASPEGAMIAGFAVDADLNGYTESSVLAVTSWDHARVRPSVFVYGHGIDAPPVAATLYGGTYSVHITASWGSSDRSWKSTLHAGCASTGGAARDAGVTINDTTVDANASGRLLAVSPRSFGGVSVAPGAGASFLTSGRYSIAGEYLLGSFGLDEGSVWISRPDGSTESRSSPDTPLFAVEGGVRGPWEFGIDWGILQDPGYPLIALDFS